MRRHAAVAVVVVALFVGATAPLAFAAPAGSEGATVGPSMGDAPSASAANATADSLDGATAAQTSLRLQTAFEGATDTGTLSFTFTASQNTTVTATSEKSDGEVTFTFDRWSGGGGGGSDETFQVTSGEQYTVYYEAVGESRGQSGTDTTRSVDVDVGSEASERLSADVTYVEPSFGTTDASDGDVLFEGESQKSTTVEVSFRNDGRGDMNVTSTRVSSDTHLSASVEGLPSRVDAGDEGTFEVNVTVDDSADEGTKDVAVVVEDSLGNSETIRFSVEVRKATKVTPGQEEYDFGDVLRGSSESRSIQIAEETGYDSVDVEVVEAIGAGPNASLSVSGLEGQIRAGGTESGTLQVSVDGRSPQHEELSWTVRLEPTDDQDANARTFTVTARTAYPASFGRLTASSTSYSFDEPRGSGTFTETVDAEVANDGDLPLEVQSVSVSSPDISDEFLSAEVAGGENPVPGLSSRDYAIDVTVDSQAPAGEHTLVVEYQSSNASAGTETVETQIEIAHETRVDLDENELSFGRLEIARQDTRTVSVEEVLGYNDVENLTLERVDGPDEGWLTVDRGVPETLDAGGAAEVVFGLRFDTDAEVLTEYAWTYRVDGDDIEAHEVTITAEPGLIEAAETKDRLSTIEDGGGSVASGASAMRDLLTSLESKIEDGNLESGADISRGFTSARTYVTFANATQQARTHLDAGENDAAQRDLIRAASTYNTITLYVSNLEDPELRTSGQDALDEGNAALNELIENQRAYYQQRLSSEDTSLLEAALVKRELARIAVLEGDDERADQLQSEAERAFESYATNVSEGQSSLQSARSDHETLTAETLTVVEGQPLLLNPAALGSFESDTEAVLADYDTAQSKFEAAGADEAASDVAEERAAVANDYETAETALYVASGLYVLAFVGVVVHLVRGTVAYVSDANETATGEFLV